MNEDMQPREQVQQRAATEDTPLLSQTAAESRPLGPEVRTTGVETQPVRFYPSARPHPSIDPSLSTLPNVPVDLPSRVPAVAPLRRFSSATHVVVPISLLRTLIAYSILVSLVLLAFAGQWHTRFKHRMSGYNVTCEDKDTRMQERLAIAVHPFEPSTLASTTDSDDALPSLPPFVLSDASSSSFHSSSLHSRSDVARFLHITDAHLEYAYADAFVREHEDGDEDAEDAGRKTATHDDKQPHWSGVSKASRKRGLCRRMDSDKRDYSDKGGDTFHPTHQLDWEHEHENEHQHESHGRFPLGRIGCDPPLLLLQSAVEKMATLAGTGTHPMDYTKSEPEYSHRKMRHERHRYSSLTHHAYAFVLLTGDLVAHFVDDAQVHQQTLRKSLEVIVRGLDGSVQTQRRPLIQGASQHHSMRMHIPFILPAIGNIDLFPTNFIERTQRQETFWLGSGADGQQRNTASADSSAGIACHPTFRTLLESYRSVGLLLDPDVQQSFCHGGFYAIDVPLPNLGNASAAAGTSTLPKSDHRSRNRRANAANVPNPDNSDHLTAIPTIRVIILNSIPYSPEFLYYPIDETNQPDAADNNANSPIPGHEDLDPSSASLHPVPCDSPSRDVDPFDQFSWLHVELLAARDRGIRVVLASHIPPGHKDRPGHYSWCERYVKEFKRTIAAFVRSDDEDQLEQRPPTIMTSVFGDYSEDLIRFMQFEDSKPADKDKVGASVVEAAALSSSSSSHISSSDDAFPSIPPRSSLLSVFIAPGLSPRKDLNPSFRIYYLDHLAAHATVLSDSNALANKAHESRDVRHHHRPSSKKLASLSYTTRNQRAVSKHDDANTTHSPTKHVRLLDYAQWYLPLSLANKHARKHEEHSHGKTQFSDYSSHGEVYSSPSLWQVHYSFRSSFPASQDLEAISWTSNDVMHERTASEGKDHKPKRSHGGDDEEEKQKYGDELGGMGAFIRSLQHNSKERRAYIKHISVDGDNDRPSVDSHSSHHGSKRHQHHHPTSPSLTIRDQMCDLMFVFRKENEACKRYTE